MIRELPMHILDDWLDNWSRWSSTRIVATINVSDCDYESPERNHHEQPVRHFAPPPPVNWEAAQLCERAVVECDTDGMKALIATYVRFPESQRTRHHIKAARWESMRAHDCGLSRVEFQEALSRARHRLARVLYPHAHLIKTRRFAA